MLEKKETDQEACSLTLTKELLIHELKTKMNLSYKSSRCILETILEEIKAALEKKEDVKICAFGKWAIRDKSSRPGRNPYTGTPMQIKQRRVVTFYPSIKLKTHLELETQAITLCKNKKVHKKINKIAQNSFSLAV